MSTRKRKRHGIALTREELVTVGFGAAVLLVLYWGVRGMDPSGAVAGLAGAMLALLRLLYGKATDNDNGDDPDPDPDTLAARQSVVRDPDTDHTRLDNRRVAADRGRMFRRADRRAPRMVC